MTETRENIANFDNLKHWLNDRTDSFVSESNALPTPRGVLLMGVQGCGKSLAIKVVAKELGLPSTGSISVGCTANTSARPNRI